MKFLIIFIHIFFVIGLTAYPQILTIHHIDVGPADATFIRTQYGKTVLIDAGDRGMGRKVVYPYLLKNGVTSLDFVVASHYHADHIGGLDEVLQSFPIDSIGIIIDRGFNSPLPITQSFLEYRTIANRYPYHLTVTPGQIFTLGNNVTLKCLTSDGSVLDYGEVSVARSDENNLSLAWIISTEYILDGKKYLFRYFTGGDCGGTSENYADIETPLAAIVGDVDVMKVNHHGSRYSTNNIFLDIFRPEAVIISVGNNNRYNHPAVEIIDRLTHSPSIRSIYQTEYGSLSIIQSNTARAKVKVAGNIQIAVFDSFYTVGTDTYALASQMYERTKSDTRLVPVAEDTSVTILIYNILGIVVDSLKHHGHDEDEYKRSLDRANLSSGVYFLLYELSTGKLIRKVVYIR